MSSRGFICHWHPEMGGVPYPRYMGVNPKTGGGKKKMDGKKSWENPIKMDDLEGYIIIYPLFFGLTPIFTTKTSIPSVQVT